MSEIKYYLLGIEIINPINKNKKIIPLLSRISLAQFTPLILIPIMIPIDDVM